MPDFDRKDLEKVAALARLELAPEKGEKLLADLKKIIGYFGELSEADTEKAALISGGTDLQNQIRPDEGEKYELIHRGREQFPRSEDGFLETPPVFENEQ
jgi:aspartyl-tRNA(Asn)/glutamyl-tRNA(Gln) amidotransferase subunit C